MTLVFLDRVMETSTVVGTAAYKLNGAIIGYQAFSKIGDGNTCYYAVTDNIGNWEVGLGTYTLSTTTLARTTILASSNAGAAVSWPVPNAKFIWLDLPASVGANIPETGLPLPIGLGGTGASTALGARTNLGIPTGSVVTIAGLLTLDTTVNSSAVVAADLVGGTFELLTLANLPAAEQTAAALDTANSRGIYVVSTFDSTKVWKRIYAGAVAITWFGAVPNAVFANVALAINSGSAALTATGASFTSADVGKNICVPGAGAAGVLLYTTIAGFTGTTQVTLGTTASIKLADLAAVAAASTLPLIVSTSNAAVVYPQPTYANGTLGVGATLTGVALAGTLPVLQFDGYTPVLNDRILIQSENVSPQWNGVYALTTVGTSSVAYVLTRVTDFDQSAEIVQGTIVPVTHGTVQAGQNFMLATSGAVTVGTTPLTFTYSAIKYWTDNQPSIQNCINVVLALGGGDILVPAGGGFGCNTTVTPLDPGIGKIKFIGQEGGYLIYFEGITETETTNLFRNTTASTTKGPVHFIGMHFKGTLDLYGRRANNPVFLDYYSLVRLEECTWDNIASEAMDLHFLGRFEAVLNRLTNIAADGIRCRDTPNGLVQGNFIQRTGDDPIAIHTADSTVPAPGAMIRERWVIDSNILVNGGGSIHLLGARGFIVTNNILRFCDNAGISIGVDSPEGDVPIRDDTICNNHIYDMVLIASGVPSSSANGIVINGTAPRGATSTDSFYPGLYDTTASKWIYPWNYDNTITSNSVNPVSPISGLVIDGNELRRTQPAVSAFSMYGFGNRLGEGVVSDPQITDANLNQDIAIAVFSGGLHNSHIDHNVVKDGYIIGVSLAAPTSNYDYQSVTIDDNDFFGTNTFGILVNSSSFNADIAMRRNTLNCDPWRTGAPVPQANSNLNGSYVASGLPWGIDIGSNTGISIEQNTFANCCVPVQANVPVYFLDNLQICGLPAAVGSYNVGNKGIGVPNLAGLGWRYKLQDCDPTSATFNAIVSMQVSEAAAQPSTGSWVEGTFVKNIVPALSGGVTNYGWLRLTTGSGNVAGTDWANAKVAN